MLLIFRHVITTARNNYTQIRCLCRTYPKLAIDRSVFSAGKKKREIGPLGWFLLVVPAATFALGTWQVQRKKWKESLIDQLQSKTKSQPVMLPSNINDLEDLEYYPVHVRGTYLHDKEMYMGPRTVLESGDSETSSQLMSSGNTRSQGYLVITPFKLDDRDETILINRGWVPMKNKDPNTRPKGQVTGTTDVIGVVRLHENRPPFMPTNQEQTNSWFYRDLDKMSEVTGSSPIFIDATTDFPIPDGPIGGQTRITLRNEHLSYILTWYSLGLATSFMWYMHFIKKAM